MSSLTYIFRGEDLPAELHKILYSQKRMATSARTMAAVMVLYALFIGYKYTKELKAKDLLIKKLVEEIEELNQKE